jgi:4-hydroxy-L-threonine phosphate dehydrogenase PdxA
VYLHHECLTQGVFRVEHPWIKVCGLNPHAGEQGLRVTKKS